MYNFVLFFKVLAKQALMVMKSIAGNDDVKRTIVESGGIQLVLQVMSCHQRSVGVSEAGCTALAVIALRVPENCHKIVTMGGVELLIKAMQIHPNEVAVQVLA